MRNFSKYKFVVNKLHRFSRRRFRRDVVRLLSDSMKIKLILICIFINNSFLLSQDFRNTKWGMSFNYVQLLEKLTPIEITPEKITYNENIFEMDCTLFYEFYDSSLARAGYIFSEDYNNIKLYLGYYEKLKKILVSKYGKPTNEFARWGKSPNRFADWSFEDTKIHLILSDVFSVGFKLVYENPALTEKLKLRKEKIDKEKF